MSGTEHIDSKGSARDNLEGLRFSYERKLFDAIDQRFGEEVQRRGHDAKNLLTARRRALLGDAVRVTADLLPEVHAAYRTCLDALGGGYGGDLFVQQSSDYNANVFADGKRFDVVVYSGLLGDFTLNELRFVLGHELGHVLFGHSTLSVYEVLENTRGLEPADAHLLFRWSRASEISADRIGLLCAGELTVAVTALFKTSSGLKGIDGNSVLQSFRRQYDQLQEHIESEGGPHGWARTHPMAAIRFKALELAALDIVALRQGSPGFSWHGFRALDREIATTLEYLDVPAGPTRGFGTVEGQLCLLTSLLHVALSDGSLSWKHRWFIHDVYGILESQLPLERMIEAATSDVANSVHALLQDVSASKDMLASGDAQRIVTTAALMLGADADVSDRQVGVLRGLATALGLDSEAVTQAKRHIQQEACSLKELLLG